MSFAAKLLERRQARADRFADRGKRWPSPGVYQPTTRELAEHVAGQQDPDLARRMRGERKRARRHGVAPRRLLDGAGVKSFLKALRQLGEAEHVTKDAKKRLKAAAEGR